jgi:hypothetical protein
MIFASCNRPCVVVCKGEACLVRGMACHAPTNTKPMNQRSSATMTTIRIATVIRTQADMKSSVRGRVASDAWDGAKRYTKMRALP